MRNFNTWVNINTSNIRTLAAKHDLSNSSVEDFETLLYSNKSDVIPTMAIIVTKAARTHVMMTRGYLFSHSARINTAQFG